MINFLFNMGPRYVAFRLWYEFQKRTGLLKRKFPVNTSLKYFISLEEWRNNPPAFLISAREALDFEKNPSANLENEAKKILEGQLQFFNSEWKMLGKDYDWITNPQNGFQFDSHKHWTQIPDLSPLSGDIKYVWEKSRFGYLQTIIRYDYHFGLDHSEWVFQQLDSWIEANPINQGPNYRCSQEMSLRLLNWMYALYFYQNADALTAERWNSYQHVIYWHLHHIYHHINFSRIAVRNNHAITETAMLFISAMLFPFIPETKHWSAKGKKWLEQELNYQIYDDGTYLQFSMNYQRVVVQLLTLSLKIGELHQNPLSSGAYEKAYRCLNFLYQCQQLKNGYLPNYGSNDGALFFKWSSAEFRDYRPQLNSLHKLLTGKNLYSDEEMKSWGEDASWLGLSGYSQYHHHYDPLSQENGIISFPVGGYYLIREEETLTFLRCGTYKDRPHQADMLHIDVWVDGQNILHDSGSYSYNAAPETIRYFMGTVSHNTVQLADYDQMLKGSRFIWFFWIKRTQVNIRETEEYWEVEASAEVYRYLGKKIWHKRVLRKTKRKNRWEVEDTIANKPLELQAIQNWHTLYSDQLRFKCESHSIKKEKGWYSSSYGSRVESTNFKIPFDQHIITEIQIS